MRSVGKIERDDWNMKEIERKIQENRLGRPEPKTAEKVPKWDREQVSSTFYYLYTYSRFEGVICVLKTVIKTYVRKLAV